MVNHYIPTTLQEALELLYNNNLEIIAGGTDLMVQRRTWANTKPKFNSTINIFNLRELHYIHIVGDNLHIGSTTPLNEILVSDYTPELLKKSIEVIASPALRNLATIAGNIGNASPAGDTLPILYALDAKINIIDLHNETIVPIEEVILGPRKTILQPNQLIKEIIIPLTTFTKTSFVKVGGRKADAISKLSFTAAVTVDKELIKDIRIVFGAVAPTMVRVKEIENKILDKSIQDVKEMIPSLLMDYKEHIRPIDDQRSNKEYRKQVSLNLLEDFLQNI